MQALSAFEADRASARTARCGPNASWATKLFYPEGRTATSHRRLAVVEEADDAQHGGGGFVVHRNQPLVLLLVAVFLLNYFLG